MAVIKNREYDEKKSTGIEESLFSDEDYKLYLENEEMWRQGDLTGNQTMKDAAHDRQEKLRAKYGFSGGADGMSYNPVETPVDTFSYEAAPVYASKYQTQINELLGDILGAEKFTYDAESDPMYQQLAKTYQREGNRAMQDTLAQVAARTGGIASSYAGSAAADANNYYAEKLADRIPELRELAYSMYQNEQNAKRDNLSTLMGLEQMDYGRYMDALGQWNADRDFSYGVSRDQTADQRYENEWQYGVGRDQVSDSRYEDETAYERGQDERQNARNEVDAILAAGGSPSPEMIAASGYSPEYIQAIRSYYAAATSGGGGGGGGGGSSDTPDSVLSVYEYLDSMGIADKAQAEAQLDIMGFDPDWADGFMSWKRGQKWGDGVAITQDGQNAYDTVAREAAQYAGNPQKLDTYLTSMVNAGRITEAQAVQILKVFA